MVLINGIYALNNGGAVHFIRVCFHFSMQNYTQYIPLSLYDLQNWMGNPSIYVYDCSHAGQIIESFQQFSYQRESELMMMNVSTCDHNKSFLLCIKKNIHIVTYVAVF